MMETAGAPLQFSVIICTYNRANMLGGAVESVVQQSLDPSRFEIIIVDNCSRDGTREEAARLQAHYAGHTIRYVYEPNPGLGNARLAGLRIAQAEWLAFLDDDARAAPGWLAAAAGALRDQPGLHGLGGPIHPLYLAEKPAWFQDEYEIRDWGSAERFLRKDEAFAGGNMFFPRRLLEQLATVLPNAGMVGNFMRFGEDTALFERAWEMLGQPIFLYQTQMVVYHVVPARNMDTGYILRRQFSIGASNFRRSGPRRLFRRVLYILRHTGSLLRLATRMILSRGQFPRRENWLVERGGPVAKKLGLLSAALGLNIQFRQRQEAAP